MPVVTTDPAEGAVTADDVARLRAVIGGLNRRLSRATRGSGLTPSQLSVLGVVSRSGPMRLSDLAAAEGLNPTMLSRVVAVLEDAGYLRRRPDASDGRASLVEVTAAGRRHYERLRAERGRMLATALEQLAADDRDRLLAALPALEALVAAVGPAVPR